MSPTSVRIRHIAVLAILFVFAGIGSIDAQPTAPSLQQAGVYFALGSLDAAEQEIRRFLETNPGAEAEERAISLLTEIRVERQREKASAGREHSGGAEQIGDEPKQEVTAPRVVDPNVMHQPAAQVVESWQRAFPGAPAQFRKDGIYAITAEQDGAVTTIRIFRSGGTEVAQKRIESMLVLDFLGLPDALPRGGLDLPSGGATRVRHSQLSEEPLVSRVVIDLKSQNITSSVVPGEEAVIVTLEDRSALPTVNTTGQYRTPISTLNHRIEIKGGNFQRGLVGGSLPEQLAIRVLNPQTGAPAAGIPVRFYSVDAGMEFDPQRVTTSSEGIASTTVRLDNVVGRKLVLAQIPNTAAEASFEVYAIARPPDTLEEISGDGAEVKTRQRGTEPLVVSVQDVYGNPVPGVAVKWKYAEGDGTLDADPEQAGNQSVTETDEAGRASLRNYTAGARPGTQRIQASFTTGDITRVAQFEINALPQLISLDFFQTPVPDILRFLGRIANWNLILSDGVLALGQPEVTVHLENVPVDEALDKILSMKSLTRVEQSDGSIKIVTFVEAQTQGQAVITDMSQLDDLPQDVVRTVVLDYRPRDVAAVRDALTRVLSPNATIITANSGQIIITDYVGSIRRARDIIFAIDKFVPRVFTLQHVSGQNLNEYLRAFVGPDEQLIIVEGGVLFAGTSGTAATLAEIIAQIDSPDNTGLFAEASAGEMVTKVFQIRYTDANQIKTVLEGLFKQQEFRVTTGGTGNVTRQGRPPVSPATNQQQQQAANGAATTTVVRQDILVVADERTNKLFVTAPTELMSSIEAVISELDAPKQTAAPIILEAPGLDIGVLQTIVNDLYPGVTLFADAANNRLILFVEPDFDRTQLDALVESMISSSAGLRPLVIDAGGIDIALLESMIRDLYPRARLFVDGGRGRVILFVDQDFDESFIKGLVEEIRVVGADDSDSVMVRQLKYANAATMASLLQELKNQAATGLTQTEALRDARRPRTRVIEREGPDGPVEIEVPVATAAPELAGIASGKIAELKVVQDQRTNSLILIAPPSVLDAINQLIDRLDQPVGVWEVIPLQNADAVTVSEIVQQIFPTARILAERSSNSIFAIVNTRDELPSIKEAVSFLDQPRGAQIDDTTVIVRLDNSDVAEVTNILNQLFSADALQGRLSNFSVRGDEAVGQVLDFLREQDRADQRSQVFQVMPITSKNLLVLQGHKILVDDALRIIARIESAEPFADPTANDYVKVYHLKHLLPSQLVDIILATVDRTERTPPAIIIDPESGRSVTQRGDPQQAVRMIAEDSLKTLIVYTQTAEHVQIATLIREFDNPEFAKQQELQFIERTVEAGQPALIGKWLRDNLLNQGGRDGEFMLVDSDAGKIFLWIHAATSERLDRLWDVVDRDQFSFDPYRFFQSPAIEAPEMVTMLQALYPALTGIQAVEDAQAVVVFGDQAVLDEISLLIRDLEERSNLQYRFYSVEDADPAAVAQALRQLALNSGVEDQNEVNEIADPAGSGVHVWARPGTHIKIAELLPELDIAGLPSDPAIAFEIYVFENASVNGLRATEGSGVEGDDLLESVEDILSGGLITGISGSVLSGVNNWILLYGSPSSVERGLEFLKKIDEAWGRTVQGAEYEIIQLEHRAPSEIMAEIGRLMAGHGLEIVQLPRKNALLVMSPPKIINRMKKLVAEFDRPVPYRIFRSSFLHTNPDITNMMTAMFPSAEFIQIAPTAAGAFEQVIVRAPERVLAQIESMWASVDTAGSLGTYRPRFRNADELISTLQQYMVHMGVFATPADDILLFGEPARIEDARVFLRSIDARQPTRVLEYGRLNIDDAISLVQTFHPSVEVSAISDQSLLVAQGNEEALDAAEAMLAEIERGLRWRIYPLTRISGAEVQQTLQELFGSVRITSLPAGNGVAILATERKMAEVLEFLRRLESASITLIPVTEANPATISDIIREFFPDVGIQVEPNLNRIIIEGDTVIAEQIRQFVRQLDEEVHTAIRPLKYYSPDMAVEEVMNLRDMIQNNYLSSSGRIHYDRQNNSYVITDSLEKVQRALRIIDDLDRQPPQVLIEAAFVDVVVGENDNLEFDWNFQPDLTDFGFAAPAEDVLGGFNGGASVAFPNNEGGVTIGLARNNLGVTVNAVLTKQDGRIVLTPKVVTRNNVEARLNVGTEVTVQPTCPQDGNCPEPTTTRGEVGIVVTPTIIHEQGNVRMKLLVSNDDAPNPTLSATATITRQNLNSVNTVVDVPDGATLVLGGLMRQEVVEGEQKIPFLGDIPGIGRLFKSTTKTEVTRELLVFISPRILYPHTHELQMEEEINRYKYLVNFPADWSGRRWLVNNKYRGKQVRDQIKHTSNYIVDPPKTVEYQTGPEQRPSEFRYDPMSRESVRPTAPSPRPGDAAPAVGVTQTLNVNTATAAQFKTLPTMPPHVAELIVSYRNTNGSFRSVGELINVPGMTSELLNRIAPHLRVTATPTPLPPSPTPVIPPTQPAPAEASSSQVNINTAGVTTLMSLPGLSEANARMIVAYRGTYGSFGSIDELIDVPGITPELYGQIRPFVTVQGQNTAPVPAPVTSRVNVNTATATELAAISGLSNENANLIVAYRSTYGSYGKLSDLLEVPSITPEILVQIQNRITVGNAEPQAAPQAATGDVVNVNTATAERFGMIPELSEQNINLIIAYRNSYGGFASVNALLDVPTITPELLAQVRDRLTVQ